MTDHGKENDAGLEQWVDEKIGTLGRDSEWQPDLERAHGRFTERTRERSRWSGPGLAAVVLAGAVIVVLALPWQILNPDPVEERSSVERTAQIPAEAPEGPDESTNPPASSEESEMADPTENSIVGYRFEQGVLTPVYEGEQVLSPEDEETLSTMAADIEQVNAAVRRIQGLEGAGAGVGEGNGGPRAGVGAGNGAGLGAGTGASLGQPATSQNPEDDVTPPRVIARVQPLYPREARADRIQGTVVLECNIDEDGAVEVLRIPKSLGHGLDEAAIDAVQQWRFAPGTRNGEPVATVIDVEVSFTLR